LSKQIGLTVPQREKPAKGAVDIKPRRLEQWVANLPRANLGETARQVFNVLVDSNHLDLAYQDRARFLETLLEPIQYVTDGMSRHFVGAAFPLPEKRRNVAAVSRKIFAELATAYRICIEDLLSHSVLFVDNRLLTKLIHRAIVMSGRELLTSYQAYAPEQGDWGEIHKLYAYAESQRIQHAAVNDRWHPEGKSTIEDEYKRVLLTSLAGPYRLRQGEVSKVYQTLAYWSAHTELHNNIENEEFQSGFITCLAGNSPPRHLALKDSEQRPENCRLLETHGLTKIVRDEIGRASHLDTTTLPGIDMQRPDLSHDLLCRLLVTWTGAPKRVFSRSRKEEPVQVAMGLSTAHRFIAGAGHALGEQSYSSIKPDRYFQPAHFDSVTVGEFHSPKHDDSDVWGMIYPSADALRSFTDGVKEAAPEKETAPESTTTAPATETRAETWHIVNESAGGYCLENDANSRSTVHVGELVGIRRSGDGHTWKWGIGVVRWLNFSEQATLRLGIEMLTPDAAAAGVRVTSEAVGTGQYQRTLMLPQIAAIKKPATLVTPPVPYREGSQVTVRILGKEMRVKLTRQIENTGLFAQFQFDVMNDELGTTPTGETQSTRESHSTPKSQSKGETYELDLQEVWASI
jgi:hypothetical protein